MSSKFHNFGRGLGCFLLLAALLGVVYWFVIRPNLNGSATAPDDREKPSEETASNADSHPESATAKASDGKDYELVEEDETVVSSDEIPEDELPDNPEEPDEWQ